METVCVTGAGGFIASWVIKMLLSKGYSVRGTLRNPGDTNKYQYLTKLEGANERLLLCKADILHYDSLLPVIAGCHGVFHMACPLTDDPEQVIDAAVEGTRNVLDACAETGVKRCVVTSSIGAVYMNPRRDPEAILHDDCWSDLDYCIQTKNWYCYAKTVAEQEAWKARNLEVVVVNPSLVLGPLLQPSANASIAHIMKYLTGSAKTYANLTQAYVDVRDVAEAHILLYETPAACGRYLCAESSLHRGDLVAMLAKLCPQYPLPTRAGVRMRKTKGRRRTSNPIRNWQTLGCSSRQFRARWQTLSGACRRRGCYQPQLNLQLYSLTRRTQFNIFLVTSHSNNGIRLRMSHKRLWGRNLILTTLNIATHNLDLSNCL